MIPSNPITIIVILVCLFFFYCAGRFEGASGVAWAGLSVLVSMVVFYLFRGGFMLILVGQVGLFIAITIFRARQRP